MLFDILLIIGSLFVFSAFAEELPEYTNPYAPIFTDQEVYSWTDKIFITIAAPSWNANRYGIDSIGTQEGHLIKISTSEHTLEPYKLTETEPSSGIFVGEVILTGFLHDVDGDGKFDTNPRTMGGGPTNGLLETDRDEGVTISFEFADGVVLTHSALIAWNIGEVMFQDSAYFVGETARIQVIDPDLNLNPEGIDQVDLEVSSTSDAAGILVDAIETSEDSGLFEATISFSQSLSSSGNRLFALPGDSLQVKYEDYTLPRPYSTSDNLEITSDSRFESNIPPLERISFDKNFLTNSLGEVIYEPKTNEQLQIVGAVKNNQNYDQNFVFIVQIKDKDGKISSLSWVLGELVQNQNLELSQSWTPIKAGDYTVETFVWKSLSDPVPLSPTFSKSYIIQDSMN